MSKDGHFNTDPLLVLQFIFYIYYTEINIKISSYIEFNQFN